MSAGAVSANTTTLEQLRMIDRMTFPKDRSTYYLIAPNAWEYVMDAKLKSLAGLREIAARGLDVIADAPDEAKQRLHSMIELLDFMDEEFGKLVTLWHAREETK